MTVNSDKFWLRFDCYLKINLGTRQPAFSPQLIFRLVAHWGHGLVWYQQMRYCASKLLSYGWVLLLLFQTFDVLNLKKWFWFSLICHQQLVSQQNITHWLPYMGTFEAIFFAWDLLATRQSCFDDDKQITSFSFACHTNIYVQNKHGHGDPIIVITTREFLKPSKDLAGQVLVVF